MCSACTSLYQPVPACTSGSLGSCTKHPCDTVLLEKCHRIIDLPTSDAFPASYTWHSTNDCTCTAMWKSGTICRVLKSPVPDLVQDGTVWYRQPEEPVPNRSASRFVIIHNSLIQFFREFIISSICVCLTHIPNAVFWNRFQD